MKKKIKKRRRTKQKLLFVDYESLTREQIIATINEIRQRLIKHFRFHVGLANATSPAEIFSEILGIKTEMLDIYKRDYWWRVLKNVMSNLRREEDCFIIHRGHKFFVLQTQEESEGYKSLLRRDIKGLVGSMNKADKWVKEGKWKDIMSDDVK